MMLDTSRLSCAWGFQGSGLMPWQEGFFENAVSLMQFDE